jgi:mono/diheme cytochrome c family protein
VRYAPLAAVVIGALAMGASTGVGEAVDSASAVGGAPAALLRGDCHRCHDIPGAPKVGRVESCADCHAWIVAVAADPAKRERAMQAFPLWERYERNTASYLPVPSLAAAAARLEPAWVETWLADPHDLRPALPEGMPRFALTAAERAAIASWMGSLRAPVPASAPPDASRLAAGEALFQSKGCVGCHSFGGRHTLAAVPLAPDLAHTRRRMSPDHLAAWIRDPKAVSAEATMPTVPLSEPELLALRDYVLLAPTQAKPEPAWTASPPPLAREVSWAEVEERVFGRICVHCHMDPANNQGRTGPGNGGGFGWPATGIALETPAQVAAVAHLIPDALERRRKEAARDVVHAGHEPRPLTRPTKPGMPMGLPPLSDADTALVLAWIAQGAKP